MILISESAEIYWGVDTVHNRGGLDAEGVEEVGVWEGTCPVPSRLGSLGSVASP